MCFRKLRRILKKTIDFTLLITIPWSFLKDHQWSSMIIDDLQNISWTYFLDFSFILLILKSVPKLYAVIVKLYQYWYKNIIWKTSLWFLFYAYQADFLNDKPLKISKFFITKMKKKNFRFENFWSVRITMYIFWLVSSSWTQIYLSRSKKIDSSPPKSRY